MSNQVTERPRRKRPPARRSAQTRPGQIQKRKKKAKVRSRVALGKIFGRTFVRRLAISIGVAVLVILALMAFLRVRNVSVVGNAIYAQSEIQEASGITQGSGLLLVNKTAAASRIRAQLPYIDEVRVGISLPDTVKIEVVELETTFAVSADDGSFWLVNSGGRLIERITGKAASDYLKIEGVRICGDGQTGDQAQAVEEQNEAPGDGDGETTDTDGEAPPEASAGERLDVALQIVRQLSEGEDIRSVTSVDVTSIYDLQIWYGTRFQIKLGGTSELSYKLDYMLAAISQLDSYQTGVLDLTFQEAKKATFIPWSS